MVRNPVPARAPILACSESRCSFQVNGPFYDGELDVFEGSTANLQTGGGINPRDLVFDSRRVE